MNKTLISSFLHPYASIGAEQEPASCDEATSKRSATLRDLCISLLKSVRANDDPTKVSDQIERLMPQLERHGAFQYKVKKWHFARDFDTIGNFT